MGQNSIQIVTNSKTQILTKLKKLICDKTWTMTNINLWEEEKNFL